MKILHITPHLGGGVGRVLLSWLVAAQDHEHRVYCLEESNAAVKKRIRSTSLSVCVVSGNQIEELRKAVLSSDIVVVHWWNNPGLYHLLVNEQLPPCRMIVWSHVAGHDAPQVFSKSLIEFPDRFVVATPWSLQAPILKLFDTPWRQEHLRLIFTCAGIERVHQVQRGPHEHFTIGYVGTVDYCKLHASFLRMSASARIPGVRFVVCGGEQHHALRQEAREQGIDGAFVFTGHVETINDYLGTFDVFGYPLRPDHYGTGEQALIEAMASGLPAVVFNNGSERYLVKDKVTGLIVENEHEYTAALEHLYTDEALRNKLGNQARQDAQERFSLAAMTKEWDKLFHETASIVKREHFWPGKKPIQGSRLFIESLGESGVIFQNSLSGDLSANQADEQIAQLTGAHRAQTRGSVFHYRSWYPLDPFLNFWCALLEREMGLVDKADASVAVAYQGGITRPLRALLRRPAHFGEFEETIRPCPLCGSHRATVITNFKFAMFENNPLASMFPWDICAKCGFSFYATQSLPGHFDKYYDQQSYYFSSATSGSGSSHPADIERYRDIGQCLFRHVNDGHVPVFDVGSGKGGLLTQLKEMGFIHLYAVDMVDGCIQVIRENLKFHADKGSAAHLPFENVTPHILIYSHILEHLYDPLSALSEAYRRLSAGGIIYLEVPDASRYGEFCSLPFVDLYFEHINHFDEAHLIAFAEAAGFKKKETGKRLFKTGTGGIVPCIYGIFGRGEKPLMQLIDMQEELGRQCYRYYKRCSAAPLWAKLEALAQSGSAVYVWGISQFAQLLLGQSALGRCQIEALIDGDTNKQKMRLLGKSVSSPETLRHAKSGDVVVLTGIGHRRQMREYLKEIHFKGHEFFLEDEILLVN